MFNSFWHNYISYPGQPLAHNFNVVEQKHFNKHLQDLHQAKSLIAQIDFDQWIWPAKTTLSSWAQQQSLEFESGGHPALSAQRSIADYVISRIRRPELIN
jgi:phospholipase/lecithinase/hemolysin